MSVRFKCPHCKTVRSLHSRMMGREVRCPECENQVAIPSQEEIDAAKAERAAEKSFLEAAKRIAATGVYNPPATQARPATAQPTAQLSLNPLPPAHDDDDEDVGPMFERRTMPHDHIDMTPMVDITFLLLIFFMSTANFTLQKALQVPVQKDQKASTRAVQVATDATQDSVTVQVDEHNAYLVLMPDGEREAASRPDLMLALQEARDAALSGEPPDKLIIEAHRDCVHKAVVVALDAGTDLKFERFQVNVVDDFE